MRAVVNGQVMPAPEINEGGRETGYADLFMVMRAYGIPLRIVEGQPMVALRAFAEALGQPVEYVAGEETVYIGNRQPDLPSDPVGADVAPWIPVNAPIRSTDSARSPARLQLIIRQFRVAQNYRYQRNRQGQDETYCNIFLWDVTRAMNAEIPHWVTADGEPAGPGQAGARELDANAVVLWLRQYGPAHGWHRGSYGAAMAGANAGRPAVMVWHNPGGIGHVAVVRPGTGHAKKGIPIAQAGLTNFDDGFESDGFGAHMAEAEFYIHP
ncbi:MAG TPA: hypothetical protein VD969_19490 [Symbiobacteriaceae bacterium]|nr:hypothetical protein [Symbiobacteriaceae bacterium]